MRHATLCVEASIIARQLACDIYVETPTGRTVSHLDNGVSEKVNGRGREMWNKVCGLIEKVEKNARVLIA